MAILVSSLCALCHHHQHHMPCRHGCPAFALPAMPHLNHRHVRAVRVVCSPSNTRRECSSECLCDTSNVNRGRKMRGGGGNGQRRQGTCTVCINVLMYYIPLQSVLPVRIPLWSRRLVCTVTAHRTVATSLPEVVRSTRGGSSGPSGPLLVQ